MLKNKDEVSTICAINTAKFINFEKHKILLVQSSMQNLILGVLK